MILRNCFQRGAGQFDLSASRKSCTLLAEFLGTHYLRTNGKLIAVD